MNLLRRLALATLMVTALSARAAAPDAPTKDGRAVEMVIIGAFGLAAAGGYTLGAYLTGDQPSGYPLAIIGGVGAGGMLGTWLGVAIMASLRPDRITVGTILVPLLSGLAGAAIGGVTAGFTAKEPGAARTATHGVIIGLLLTDTLIAELTTLAR